MDIQELNKRFYKELSNWYFWAVDSVTFPDDASDDVEVRNATSVIRMITRLIFVWFIKERNLVPDDFFNQREIENILNNTDPDKSTYYKAILQNLFFATLNQEMNTPQKPNNRKFRGANRQHYNITSLYRYKGYFSNPADALKKFESIPFLNGGLFECLDKKEGEGDDEVVLRIDGFSDRDDNQLVVPNFLFFSEEQNVDLNQVYGTRGKSYKVRGLIDILRRYKFTITENTPIEEEVALDPELLGKVFENLLAAYNPETQTTARKRSGSYYTRREIVNYMVDETLIAHLKNRLIDYHNKHRPDVELTEKLKGKFEKRLRHLVAYNDEPPKFKPTQIDVLIKGIDTIKILDPACGSGAFPMGILQKLVFILSKLDPNNEKWKQRQIDKVVNTIKEATKIDDNTIREITISDLESKIDNINNVFKENQLDYGRKLYLIENCIYGVDIQPIAAQISRLRFFISLVLDQNIDDTKNNRGVRPLPNLEINFISANTLLGITGQFPPLTPEIIKKEDELEDVRRRIFNALTPKTKDKYRSRFNEIRQEICSLLVELGMERTIAGKIAFWDPFDQNASADWFNSDRMFGISDGFDVVIGNPPYVDSELMTKTQPELREKYKTIFQSAYGNWDLFIVFIEQGIDLLKENGLISYIVPNTLIGASYSKTLRTMLLDFSFLEIRDYTNVDVFKESDVYPIVFVLRRSELRNDVSMVVMKDFEETTICNLVSANLFYRDIYWDGFFVPEDEFEIVIKCLENKSISTFFHICSAATVKEAYALKELIHEYSNELSEQQLKKLINTGTIDRFKPLWSQKPIKYINDTYNVPIVLDVDLRSLSERRFVQAQSNKIIIGGMTKILECIYDKGEYLAGKSTIIILDRGRIDLKYGLALLNSKLVSFWYKIYYRSLALAGGYLRIGPKQIETIPIPEPTTEQQSSIVSIVDEILSIKEENPDADTTRLEKQIDKIVYKLYSLTEKQIRIVEGTNIGD